MNSLIGQIYFSFCTKEIANIAVVSMLQSTWIRVEFQLNSFQFSYIYVDDLEKTFAAFMAQFVYNVQMAQLERPPIWRHFHIHIPVADSGKK